MHKQFRRKTWTNNLEDKILEHLGYKLLQTRGLRADRIILEHMVYLILLRLFERNVGIATNTMISSNQHFQSARRNH